MLWRRRILCRNGFGRLDRGHGFRCDDDFLNPLPGRLLRLGAFEANIDHNAVVLAERAHRRRTVEREIDGDRIVIAVDVDRFQRLRQCCLGVRQIPFDRLIEIERELAIGAFRHDVGRVRHFEHITGEGRLAGDLDPDHRRLLLFRGQLLLTQLPFGLARAARKLVDHLLRQAGQDAGPGLRHQIDIKPFDGPDRVDFHRARQRDADRFAVGIVPRRAHIVGGAGIEAIDRDRHRLLEADHHDRAGDVDIRLDFLLEAEQQPRIAAVGEDLDLAFDRLSSFRRARERQRKREQQHFKRCAHRLPAEGQSVHEADPAGKHCRSWQPREWRLTSP